MSYDRDKVEQVGPKKETGLRHPLKRFKPEVQLSRREKKIETKTLNSIKPKKVIKKIIEIGKKPVEFTTLGQVKKLVELVKDKTKKKTGFTVNKGDGPSKVNTGPSSNPGSSNPKRAGRKFGGRMGYKDGSMCKLATKGKGRAYGKNS